MKNHMLISVFAVALLSATADAQLLKPESLIPVPKNQLISTFSSTEIKQMPQKIKAGAPDTSDWKVAEGDWQYKSGYTGKTYPTEVRYKYSVNSEGNETNFVDIELKNALFGTAYISQNEAGDFNSLFTYDEYNFTTNVEMLDETGNPSGITIASSYVCGIPGVYGNWSQYPLSGKAHFSSFYQAKSDVYFLPEAYYDDWLYNTVAKDCKIATEYARGYYHGETSAKVKLTRGEGVTDVYYIICLKDRDEQRAANLEEQGVDVSYTSIGVRREYVSEYINEFKAGKTNEAYRIGHVDDNASEFDVPLDGVNGVRNLFIVALNGEKITDMESDVIEVRDLSGWSHYATVTFDSNIYFNMDNTGDNLLRSGIMNIEKNADGTVLRIVNPYISSDNPERNYIYLNTSFGLDKCYFERSLTPIEYEYHYKDINDKDITIKRNLVYQDHASFELSEGLSAEDLISSWKEIFTDISHGYTYNYFILALNYNNWMRHKNINGQLYVGESYAGSLFMKFENFVNYSIDYHGVSFEVDPKIEYLDCMFDSDGKIYRISTSNASGYINIYQLLRDGQMKENPKVLHYTAYSANNEALRTASIELNDIVFTAEIADITFSNYVPDDGNDIFIDSALPVQREYNANSQVSTYLVNALYKAFALYMGDSFLHFEVKDNQLYREPNYIYCGMYNFGNLGNLDVFLEFYNVSYEMNPDGSATLSGSARYGVYDDNENYKGYVGSCDFELIIPEKLTRDPAGIEEIVSDEINDKATYYNIQGQRVEYPAKGSVVIEMKGGKARKIVVR